MTLHPITNLAMWAHYYPSGDIIFSTVAYTKEDSEKLFGEYFKLNKAVRSEYTCTMVAVDLVAFEVKH